ncbi:MAG: flagellar biosynthetic protein FliO [Anaerolineae bacterium]|nr:flagellar biosynthetic protein FliO [Anaerolineae bacterium]
MKRWFLLLVVSASILLLWSQFIAAPITDAPGNNTNVTQTQKDATDALDKEDPFLAEYDPNSDLFFNSETMNDGSLWQGGIELALKLALVLSMIYLVIGGLHWLQKKQKNIDRSETAIRILETTGLGPGKSLHLIIVGEKTLLIGTTEQQFTLLAELENVILPMQDNEEEENPAFLFERELQKQQCAQTSLASDLKTKLDGLRTSIQHFRSSVRESVQ